VIIHIPTDKIFYFFIFFQFCTSDSEKKIMMEGKVKYISGRGNSRGAPTLSTLIGCPMNVDRGLSTLIGYPMNVDRGLSKLIGYPMNVDRVLR